MQRHATPGPCLLVRETNPSGGVQDFAVGDDGSIVDGESTSSWGMTNARLSAKAVTGFFRTAFLPEGYPTSVSEDYLDYQVRPPLRHTIYDRVI